MNLPLETQLESLLFFKGESISLKKVAEILKVSEEEINEALEILEEKLRGRGVQIIENGNNILMVTHPEMSGVFENLSKEELSKDLSKAALETLSIILYRGPIKRSGIDYIRGVNSQFILRALSIRGLIDKKQDPKDERAFVYSGSLELLQFLGVTKVEDLPEFNKVANEVTSFVNQKDEEKEDGNI